MFLGLIKENEIKVLGPDDLTNNKSALNQLVRYLEVYNDKGGRNLFIETKMTNKEHILALREAHVSGYKATLGCANTELCYTCKSNIVDAEARAKEKYPLPLITVPRESYAGKDLLRINTITSGEVIEFERINGEWGIYLTAEAFKVIKDLISNPTEEVEDDS